MSLEKIVNTEKLTIGLPVEYKAIIIIFFIISLIILLFLKNKFISKTTTSKLVARKAFLQLTPKQSFQVISYKNLEYILLVSQDNVSVVNKLEEKGKQKSYLAAVESL